MFGVAGWTKDDESVVLNDRFDVWKVSPTGRGGTRLTNGAAEQVRHRILNLGGQPGDPLDLERRVRVAVRRHQQEVRLRAAVGRRIGDRHEAACGSTRA